MTTRPNIVVFIPDQLRADALGCFGNPVARTPRIDALAVSGTRFSAAYGQHPFCSQSRISFLTGWYPHVHGHRTLTNLLKPWQPNALALLKGAGYHVAHVGMRGDTFAGGVTKDATSRFGWAVRPSMTWMPSPFGPDHRYGRAFYHGRRPDGLGSPALDFDEACVQTAERWLDEGLPEPWLLYVPLAFPHPPFEVEDPWFSLHDRSAVPVPLPADHAGKPRFMPAIHERYGLDRMSPEDWAEVVATYYGMVSRVDAHLGRVLDAVERTGREERTAVLFFPDHGEYLGDYGLVEKWIAGVDPQLVHNPLLVRVPDQRPGEAGGLVELLDVAATLYDLAGVDPGYTHFSRSLLPLVEDPTASHRDAAFSEGGYQLGADRPPEPYGFPYDLKHALEVERPELVGKVVAMRTPDWTYVSRRHDDDELYDRRADPTERVNLVAQPERAATVAELRGRMLEWLVETSDVLPPEGDPRFDAEGALMPPKEPASPAR